MANETIRALNQQYANYLNPEQVAEILDCSIEAVKWHVFEARRKLKERLAEYITE